MASPGTILWIESCVLLVWVIALVALAMKTRLRRFLPHVPPPAFCGRIVQGVSGASRRSFPTHMHPN
jgi:hypothetical protein